MTNEQAEIDYEALVAADDAEGSSKPTLEQVVRDNLRHFEGFARARAKQRKAVATIAEITERDPASVRRTFLKLYGRWDAFSRRVQANGLDVAAVTKNSTLPAPTAGKVWE